MQLNLYLIYFEINNFSKFTELRNTFTEWNVPYLYFIFHQFVIVYNNKGFSCDNQVVSCLLVTNQQTDSKISDRFKKITKVGLIYMKLIFEDVD